MDGKVRHVQQFHQLGVGTLGKVAALVEHVGKAPSHAGREVDAGGTEHGDDAAGHVLTAVVANPLDYRQRP
ncbi:hypothetical protein D3C78_1322120 [compost metagenome]